MTTTISGSFLLKIRNEPSVSFACDMAACGRECVTFGGKTVIVTPELKLFPRTFTRKGLPHSEFKSRLDGHRRPISGPPRAGLRPFLRPIPGINYCSLSGRCLWAWDGNWSVRDCTGHNAPVAYLADPVWETSPGQVTGRQGAINLHAALQTTCVPLTESILQTVSGIFKQKRTNHFTESSQSFLKKWAEKVIPPLPISDGFNVDIREKTK